MLKCQGQMVNPAGVKILTVNRKKTDPTTYIQYMWIKYHRHGATRKVPALNKVSHTLCANEQLYTDNEKEIKLKSPKSIIMAGIQCL